MKKRYAFLVYYIDHVPEPEFCSVGICETEEGAERMRHDVQKATKNTVMYEKIPYNRLVIDGTEYTY